jgi:hypothetical protein
MLAQLVESTRGDLMGALDRYAETPKGLRPAAVRVVVRAGPAELAALRRRMIEWVRECQRPARENEKKKGATSTAGRATLTLIFTATVPAAGKAGRSDRDRD